MHSSWSSICINPFFLLGISPHLFTRFISIGFPIEQADGADEFEDNNLAAPEPLSHNIGPSYQRNPSSTNSGVFGSLKIVLLKSKLNLLIPCGFLAILINYLSQNKVILYTKNSSSSYSSSSTTTST